MSRLMKRSSSTVALAILTYLTLPAGVAMADDPRIPIVGGWEWSAVPPFSGAGEVIVLPSGHVRLRNVEAAGPIRFSGEGIDVEAKISSTINGNLDASFSGRVFGQGTLTAVIEGVETTIFEGPFAVDSIGLLTTGSGLMHGRGPYLGATFHFDFQELPVLDEYVFTGYYLKPANP